MSDDQTAVRVGFNTSFRPSRSCRRANVIDPPSTKHTVQLYHWKIDSNNFLACSNSKSYNGCRLYQQRMNTSRSKLTFKRTSTFSAHASATNTELNTARASCRSDMAPPLALTRTCKTISPELNRDIPELDLKLRNTTVSLYAMSGV